MMKKKLEIKKEKEENIQIGLNHFKKNLLLQKINF